MCGWETLIPSKYIMEILMKKFILYLIRWQLSTPILFLCLYFLNFNTLWNTIISNLVGGCIFFFVDKKIFKS
jgi:hypothetical protein